LKTKGWQAIGLLNKNILFLIVMLVSTTGCGVSGISLNSLYLKQNYAQLIQYANQYEGLDDYGVLKVCQSLAKIQDFDDFYPCLAELKARAGRQQGTLTGQIPRELLTASVTSAIFESMLSEIELGLGNYAQSIAHGEKALSILDVEPHSTETVVDVAGTSYEVVNVLLRAYSALDNTVKTLAMIERAKNLSSFRWQGDKGFRLIRDFKILPMLTTGYYSLGDYDESLKYSKLALADLANIGILEKAFFTTMTSVNTVALGERNAENKLQSFEDTMFANRLQPRVIRARSELELGQFQEAELGFDEVLSSKLIAGMASMYYPVLHDRGRVAEALGDSSTAIDYYRKSIDVIENSRASIKSDTNKIAYVGNKQAVYVSLFEALFSQGKITEAFEVAENAKARALVDLLASRERTGTAVVEYPAAATSAVNALTTIQNKIDLVSIAQASRTRSADRGLLLDAKRSLNSQAPEYASLVTVVSTAAVEVQQLLGRGELLLEYFGTQDAFYVFALTNNEVSAAKIDSSKLDTLVRQFRNGLVQVDGDLHKMAGRRLYDQLLKPVRQQVENATALTIVPHGPLHYIPFDALYDGQKFLLENKAVRMLPSAAVLKFVANGNQASEKLLVLGNPDLGDRKLDLKGAEQEAIAIAENSPDANLLLRKRATETVVKEHGRSYGYLHFASHGVFDAEQPLSSSLLLSKDSQNDGRLTVRELYSLKLNANLVTLSACETALGSVVNGDDVVGFTRGFLYAGASSIVSSLWKVDDASTNLLMQRFYQNLKTMDKRLALTQAQLTVKESYPHPYHWAAFQLTGAL
jgi:CHAT domain-containing protein